MPKKAKAKKESPASDFIGFRSVEIARRLSEIVAANRGRVTRSEIIRTAIEEKLERMAKGEGISLTLPPSKEKK